MPAGNETRESRFHPVTFEVIRNALLNVTEEMSVTIRRAAYSTNIKTRSDFSCAFFDSDLRCVAHSFSQPAHLIAMSSIVPVAMRLIGINNVASGDSYVVNDPHLGSSHLNDITVITPVDVDGTRVGYLANMAHHIDVGGAAPASLGVSRELIQEGIVLPPVRLASGGRIDESVFKIILANIRAPRETGGDLRAQMSANVVGARRIADIVRRYSAPILQEFYDELIAYTDRWAEREIRLLPEGVYEAEGFRDGDGLSDELVRLHARVVIRDGRVMLDVSGSSKQRPSSLNCTRSMTRCALAFAIKCLVDRRLPANQGFLDRIQVGGPDGLVVTAQSPAPVVGGWEVVSLLTELAFRALHPALPDRIPACGKGLIVNLGFGGIDPHSGEYFCYMETVAGGGGARPRMDGPDAVQTTIQNTENAPVEEVELNYPIVFDRYELIPDSCGTGQYRGGLGVRRDFRFPYSDVSCTVFSDGCKIGPWGLSGGGSGRPARYILNPEGETEERPSKFTADLPKGGVLRIETPGGGGFGEPGQREKRRVLDDLHDGKITGAHAEKAYGVRQAPSSGTGQASPRKSDDRRGT